MDLIITERPGQIIEEGKVICTLMSHLFTHLFTPKHQLEFSITALCTTTVVSFSPPR